MKFTLNKEYIFNHRNYKIVSVIILALVLTYLSNISKFQYIKQVTRKFPTSKVICANTDLKEGTVLNKTNIATVSMLEKNITVNTVDIGMVDMIIGKAISTDLKAGDPILLSNIKTKYLNQTLADRIPEGKRLFTLQVQDTSLDLNNGYIRPNDKVDILATLPLEGRGNTVFTVLQNISIVSIGRSSIVSQELNPSGTSISFFVDNKDVEMLQFAKQHGSFSLSLRNPNDLDKRQTSGIDVNGFLDYEGINKVSGGGKLKIKEKGKYVN